MTQTADPLAAFRTALATASSDDELAAIADRIRTAVRRIKADQWEPYPWQHPHQHPAGWVSQRAPGVCDDRCYDLPSITIPAQGTWLLYGGRGSGKTEGVAHYVNDHVEHGPACNHKVRGGHKMLIIGPTQGDALDAAVTGPSGIQTINPAVRVVTTRGGTFVIWPNGARARVLGASTKADVESTRSSGNNCLIYLEEAAAMRYLGEVMAVSRPGLRTLAGSGANAHYVAATTPRNRPDMIELSHDQGTIVTRGRTRDAVRLSKGDREAYERIYGGTTRGRQELDAEELGDVEGALWVHEKLDLLPNGDPNPDERPGLENTRVAIGAVGWISHPLPAGLTHGESYPAVVVEAPIMCTRTVVAVDPPGGRTECGIVVVGSAGGHGYTLADLSLAGPPNTWAKVALTAHYYFGCEGMAVEHTYGGDMVPDVIRSAAEALGIPVPPIFKVPTKVGKRLRAEPVVALFQQNRAHHVGVHVQLETEETTWVPGETTDSPNRIDAEVHGYTHLLIRSAAGQVSNPARLQQSIGSTQRR